MRGKYCFEAAVCNIFQGLNMGLAFWLLVAALADEPIEPERVNTIIEALTRMGPDKVEANPRLRRRSRRCSTQPGEARNSSNSSGNSV